MKSPILTTKIYAPPPNPGIVPRPRLIEALNQGISHKLILICAPAGFGKTTLMTAWGQQIGLPSAWLSLDADDNDLTRFLVYMIAALQSISPDIGQTALAMLQSTQASPPESILTVLINELAGLKADFYLFLDDYHLIEEAGIHAALAFLLDHLPHRMHILITSRSDPPLPLSRLRARGQLMELRQIDLRFAPEEIASYLNLSQGLELTAQQITALGMRTEGWIAGLQLAALSMRSKADRDAFIQAFSGSHRFIIDYLADEVFSQQPENLRQFLRQTSILDRLTPSLCDAITGQTDSATLLNTLEDANLFLFPLDDRRLWYRYHPLFQDFLRLRLDQQERVELHTKASGWFMANGYSSEAVNHALASGDSGLAEQIISQTAVEAFNQAAFPSLVDWLEALPAESVLKNPLLAIYKGLTLFISRSPENAYPYVLAAEKALTANSPDAILGPYLCLKAHLAMCEDNPDDCIRYSREALEHLDEKHLLLRNLTLNALGQVLEMKGDLLAALEVYQQAFETGWATGDRPGAMVVFTNLVFTLNELGRRSEAVAWCRKLTATDESRSENGVQILDAVYLAWSLLALEANELDQARQYASRALKQLMAMNFSPGISWGEYILARIHLAEGDFKLAQEQIEAGLQTVARMGTGHIHGAMFAALEAQAGLDRGELANAIRWAEATGFTPGDSPYLWLEYPYFTYIRYLLARDQLEAAQSLLNTMEMLATQGNRRRKLITIQLLHSKVFQAKGETQPAIERIRRALEIAAPEGYSRAFLDEKINILGLLPHIRPTAPAFVDELLLAFQGPDAFPDPVRGLVNPLTERESEVLQLVAKGLSNREIADKLFVSLGTAKKHLNNIFSKLYVDSRTQAVAKARELGLLK